MEINTKYSAGDILYTMYDNDIMQVTVETVVFDIPKESTTYTVKGEGRQFSFDCLDEHLFKTRDELKDDLRKKFEFDRTNGK